MPWEKTDVGEQRIKFVVRAASRLQSLASLCREFGVSRTTGYRWWRRYLQSGSLTAVVEQSRRPRHSPSRTAAKQEQRVVELRREHGWGARKIDVLLREEGTVLSLPTINRILSRQGLVRKEDRHPQAPGRFQRAAPNELWQMDGKGRYLTHDGACYPLSILDDHSRYAVGLYGLPAFTAELVYPCMVESWERCGVPESMLLDHGTLWWGTTNASGLTWLSVRMIEQGIRLCYGRVHHPQTQGKVERFHRTLDEAVKHRGKPRWLREWPRVLEEIQREYNEQRPHEALGMQRPAQRYRPSARRYQAQPREWEYPEGSEVRRLDAKGSLHWEGQSWFVCEALAHRRVRIEAVEGLLLVSYRHMYVREIDRQRQTTRAFIAVREKKRYREVAGVLREPVGRTENTGSEQTSKGQV